MGFLSNLFRSSKKSAQPTEQQAYAIPTAKKDESKEKYDVIIPSKKDGAPMAYKYSVSFLLTNEDALVMSMANKEYFLTAKEIDGSFHLFSGDTDIGVLLQREEMMRDWIKRDDPYLICVEKISGDSDMCTAFLAFYKDKRKGNDWREQSVVALTSYKSEEKQENIMFLEEGEELSLEDDLDDHVVVYSGGLEIGKLPAKYARRFLEDGAYAVFFERTEETDDWKEKPYVRIYWYDRAD